MLLAEILSCGEIFVRDFLTVLRNQRRNLGNGSTWLNELCSRDLAITAALVLIPGKTGIDLKVNGSKARDTAEEFANGLMVVLTMVNGKKAKFTVADYTPGAEVINMKANGLKIT
jgi:hypothetical protein